MKILVVNAGSSSLKYQFFDMDTHEVIAKGNCDRIGVDGVLTHTLIGKDKIENMLKSFGIPQDRIIISSHF